MKPSDYGTARISPKVAFAGQKGQWEITYVVGQKGIRIGGALRVVTSTLGLDRWFLGKVTAFCDRPGVSLEVETEKTYPVSFHHSQIPAANVIVWGKSLEPGDTVRVVLGELGGYVSGRFVQTQAQTHQGLGRFQVFVDPLGNGRFSRERSAFSIWHEVPGDVTVRVKPAPAARIRCTLRSRPAAGKPMTGVVAVEDAYENHIVDESFDIELQVRQGDVIVPARVRKARNRAGATFTIQGESAEPIYVTASCWERGLYGTSSPAADGFCGEDWNTYFGDLHVMTGSHGSWCMGSTTEAALRYARDVRGFDFCAVTNTVNPKFWRGDREAFRRLHKDHEFVTMPAYENGFSTGHKNVYFLKEPARVRRAGSAAELWKLLKREEAIAVSHHSNVPSETDPELCWGVVQADSINPALEPVIEICQNRGSFEKEEIGGEVHFGGRGSSIRSILDQGFRLGFVGGTDSHQGRPGSRMSNQSGLDARVSITGGITAVLAKELTRKAIWEAVLARRCYATTCRRILLDTDLNGLEMGREVKLTRKNRADFARRTIAVKAAGESPLDRVVIVRNGEEVRTKSVTGLECSITWTDRKPLNEVCDRKIRGVYYYVKVYQTDGNVAFASPVWLTAGN